MILLLLLLLLLLPPLMLPRCSACRLHVLLLPLFELRCTSVRAADQVTLCILAASLQEQRSTEQGACRVVSSAAPAALRQQAVTGLITG